MELEISTDSAQFLQAQVSTGAFATPEQAVEAAIGLLRRDAAIREKIRRGCEQLEYGQYIELDDRDLDENFQKLFDVAAPDAGE